VIPDSLRSVLRTARHTPDRVLHPIRHQRLLKQLRETAVQEIGFVCYGNICRSPYAAAAASRDLAAAGLAARVWSGGLIGPNRPSPPAAQQVALEHGIDLAAHRSKLVHGRATTADLVFVMEAWQTRAFRRQFGPARLALLGDLDPDPIETRGIPDPFDRPIEAFRACYERVDRCIAQMVRALKQPRDP